MRALNIVVVLFLIFAVIAVDTSQSKEYSDYGCPEFDRELCLGTPYNRDREIFECYTDNDCGIGKKCCNNCNYSYKTCTKTTSNKNFNGDESLKNIFCPLVKPCYTPLLYDIRYRCGSDENCQYGYKCCRSDCYIHKVCVIGVDQEGDEIVITSTSTLDKSTTTSISTTSFKETPTKFHPTPEIIESSGSGDGFTDDDEDRKEKTTIKTTFPSTHTTPSKTTTLIHSTPEITESSGSGDGFTDDDEDRREKTTIRTTIPSTRVTTTKATTLFHPTPEITESGGGFTDDINESSGSGDGFPDDDEDRKAKTTVRTTIGTTIPSTSITTTKTTTLFHPTPEITESGGSGDGSTGSGDGFPDDDEDHKEKTTIRTTIPSTSITTTKTTTLFHPTPEITQSSGSSTRTTPKTTTTLLQLIPRISESDYDINESSGSGDGFTDDDEDHKQRIPSSHSLSTVSPTKTTIVATASHFIDNITESSGSGDGFTDDDEDHNQKTPTHITTLKVINPRELYSSEKVTTISSSTPRTIFTEILFTHDSVKSSGSGDGSTDDHEDGKNMIESSGSGDGSIGDDEDYTSSISTLKSIYTTASTMLYPVDVRINSSSSDDKDTSKHIPVTTLFSASVIPHENHTVMITTKLTTPSPTSTKDHAITTLDEGSGSGDWSTDDETKTSHTQKPPSEIHSILTTLLTSTSKPTHVLIEGSGSSDDEDFTTYVTSNVKEWKPISINKPNHSNNKEVHIPTTEKSIIKEVVTSFEGSGNSDDEDLVFLATDSTSTHIHSTNLSSKATPLPELSSSEIKTTRNNDNSIEKEGKHTRTTIHPATNKKENADLLPDNTKNTNEGVKMTTNTLISKETSNTAKEVDVNKDTKEGFDINTKKPEQIPKEYHLSPNTSHPTGLPESSLIDALHSLKEEEDNFSGDDENYDDEDNFIFKDSNI